MHMFMHSMSPVDKTSGWVKRKRTQAKMAHVILRDVESFVFFNATGVMHA